MFSDLLIYKIDFKKYASVILITGSSWFYIQCALFSSKPNTPKRNITKHSQPSTAVMESNCSVKKIESQIDNVTICSYEEKPYSYDEAKKSFDKALAQILVHDALGLHQKGKRDESAAMMKKALKLHPDAPIVHANMGFIYAADKKLKLACKSFRNYQSRNPDNPNQERVINSYMEKINCQ